jgi:anthranilate phosphoribosyltransferase
LKSLRALKFIATAMNGCKILMIESYLPRVVAGESLSEAEMSASVDEMMRPGASEARIAALLTALRIKGETVDEIAGAAAAMRRHMTPIRHAHEVLIDTCGTGGDGSGTFNISTAAALITAAAGLPVAKHGNRAVTSKSGSADVLAALGVNVEADVPRVEGALGRLGIAFCFAPLLHAAMKHVGPVRKQLGFPTIFNVLGPLANPAAAPFQLIGVARAPLREKLAHALVRLGTRRAAVVWGANGMDEVSLAGPTHVSLASSAGVEELTWSPEDFGLPVSSVSALASTGPSDSARIIRQILSGEKGPPRDIVVANAAAALWIAGRAESLGSAARMAEAAIDSSAAAKLLEELGQATR